MSPTRKMLMIVMLVTAVVVAAAIVVRRFRRRRRKKRTAAAKNNEREETEEIWVSSAGLPSDTNVNRDEVEDPPATSRSSSSAATVARDEGEERSESPSAPRDGAGGRLEFEVFISFRWQDTASGFCWQLHEALKQRDARAFLMHTDEEMLNTAGDMSEKASEAMNSAEVFIPIFSKGYAESRSCLDEMAKMVKCKKLMLPVFYDVEPREVRNQKGSYEAAFKRYEEDEGLDKKKVKAWRDALKEAGEIKGYDMKTEADGKEGKIILLIVKDVLDKVNKVVLDVAKYPVGLDSRVNHMTKLLDVESPGLRMVGIYGMGGVGKTTLAKAVYNRISSRYKASCFFSNIKEASTKFDGLVALQKQLVSEVLHDKYTSIDSVSQGINVIKRRVHSKTVLIVLDDVSDVSQLQALAGERNWFSPRSRIIITTRNKHILNLQGLKEDESYQLEELNPKESLQLFSYHAFGTAKPIEKYVDLSMKVVRVTGGLPLTLEVLGSLFFDKNGSKEWEDLLERLKRDQSKDVHLRLKISYDGLDVNEKQIFLDIACFFIGKGKERAIHMWKDSHFFPSIGIKVLLQKSLIKNESGEFEMHDQLRDMGRQIVVQESPLRPGLRSRLWDSAESLEVLHNLEGTSNIEAIALDTGKKDLTDLRTEAFAAMPGLRLLHVANVNFAGDFTCIPNKLKWLKWEGCPFKSLPSEFNLQEVVVLDLPFGMVGEVWNRNVSMIKAFDRLKVLNLIDCKLLTATPDFSSTPHIVKLILDRCILLAQVHESIGCLKNLISMSMRDCYQLKELPNSICELSSLETLDLHRCSKVSVLAMHVGDMESLKRLILDQTKIKTLPDSMRQLKKLTLLSLDGCRSLTELPKWIGSMESLRNLTLRGSTVERIPESIGHLTNLVRLNAERCGILALPHSIGNAKNLRRIYVDHTAIEEVPDSIGSLERLETLSLDGCNHIKFLPSSIGLLKNLAELSIGATLGCTGGIRELPESFGSLTALRRLYINRNAELLTVPSSFFQISSLEDLSARGCNWLEGVDGNDFSKLSSLKKLNLADSNFYTLPSLASFSFLKTLTLSFCERLLSIPQLPSSLQKLVAMGCSALETIIDISHLKALRVLKLNECTKLIDVHGLEKLRSLEELTLNDCSNLSHALRNRIKTAEFEYLSYFTVSGTPGLHQGRHQVLSFVLPKMFRCNNPQLQITGDFKDRNCAAVHIEVMVDSLPLFEATREPNLQLDDYCICDFEEGDEMLTHVGNGYRIMHVWIDGFTMAGATIYMGNLESF